MEGYESGRQLDDLDTAASSGYGGCCDMGVDLASLLALLAGMNIRFTDKFLNKSDVKLCSEECPEGK